MADMKINIPKSAAINLDSTRKNKKRLDFMSPGTRNHAKLQNLDYEKSGHTGFQKALTAKQLENIAAVSGKLNVIEGYDNEIDDYKHPGTDTSLCGVSRLYRIFEEARDITAIHASFVPYFLLEVNGTETTIQYRFKQTLSYRKGVLKTAIFPDFGGTWVWGEWVEYQDKLTLDDTPTENSTNPIKSGGVFTAFANKADADKVYTKAEALNKLCPKHSASGYPIAITDALADEQPLKLLVYGNNIGDLDSGKYNIPIKITGKNLFDISKITKFVKTDYETVINGYFTISDNIITSNIGLYAAGAYWYDSKVKLSAGKYTLSAYFMADKDSGDKTVAVGFKNLSEGTGSKYGLFTINNYREWERFSYTFEIASTSDIIPQLQAVGVKDDYTNLQIKIKDVQIERSSAATAYEPYKGKTVTAILDEPLSNGEYIDLVSKKRNGTTDITVNGDISLYDENNIICETATAPSKLDITYYQDINKVIANLTNAILAQGGNT